MRWMMEAGVACDNFRLVIRYVNHHPGSTFTDIRETLGMKESTLRYHLEQAEKGGEINSRKVGRERCYFPTSQVDRQNLNRGQRRILNIIKNNSRITIREIRYMIGKPGKKISNDLMVLEKRGMIERIEVEGVIGYREVTKKMVKDRIFKQLVIRLVKEEIDERTFRDLVDELG